MDPVSAIAWIVVDGDTLKASDAYVRVENIDTPEAGWRAECDAERMLADRATAEARSLITGAGRVEILESGTDRYGRTLAHVLVDGEDLGETLIARGVAVSWEGRRHGWCSANS